MIPSLLRSLLRCEHTAPHHCCHSHETLPPPCLLLYGGLNPEMVQYNRPFFPALRKVYVAASRRAKDAEEREKRKQWGELVLPLRATPERTQSALLWEP